MATPISWFICPDTCALFLGHSGMAYPGCHKLGPAGQASMREAELVVTYCTPFLNSLNMRTGITVYTKKVWEL